MAAILLILLAAVFAGFLVEAALGRIPRYPLQPDRQAGNGRARFAYSARISMEVYWALAWGFGGILLVALLTENFVAALLCGGGAALLPGGIGLFLNSRKEARIQRELSHAAGLASDSIGETGALPRALTKLSQYGAEWIAEGISGSLARAIGGSGLENQLLTWAHRNGRQDVMLFVRLLTMVGNVSAKSAVTLRRFGDMVRRKSLLMSEMSERLRLYYIAWGVFWMIPLAGFGVSIGFFPVARDFYWGTDMGKTLAGLLFCGSIAAVWGLIWVSKP